MTYLQSALSAFASVASTILPSIVPGMTKEGSPAKGHVGKRLYADNARIVFVNGVGSREKDCLEKTKLISSIFDNCRVEYVYIPLTYFDTYKALRNKEEPAGSTLLLGELLRLNEEIKCSAIPKDSIPARRILNGGERIICILHSGGGAAFEAIRKQLPSDLRERLDVITLGSAHLFRTGEFRNVRNFVAENDLIPAVSTYLSHTIPVANDPSIHVIPKMDGEDSLKSHGFASATNRNVLDQLRVDYEEERSTVNQREPFQH